jgi:hypothetical protein
MSLNDSQDTGRRGFKGDGKIKAHIEKGLCNEAVAMG